LIASGCT